MTSRRGRTATCALALAGTLAAGAPLATAAPAAAATAKPKPGMWIGTATAKREVASRWLSAGTVARGDLWFRLSRDGKVRGSATMTLEPVFDPARLNALVAYAKSVGGSVLGLVPLPGFAAIGSAGLNTIVGVRVAFDETLAVRQGPITGSLRQGRLTLRWARGDMDGVGFKAFFSRVDGDELLTKGIVPKPDPWAATGRPADGAGGWQVIATRTASGREDGVTDSRAVTWSAHRVGR